ncbi:hypothetical protein ACFOYU_20075 [Microvirga sp. GCM10011540]|uniref:head-tail connector protein n=1 Tax=Microvirga sp. GCM10011540 TaxID=3317338 RepID=UPI00361C7AB3
MTPILVEDPAVEPVSLPEMKLHPRADGDAEDELIGGLVTAARLTVEAASRRVLVSQRWRVVLDRWPETGLLLLPLSPIIAVESVSVRDSSGAETEIAPNRIEADTLSDPQGLAVLPPPQSPLARNGIAVAVRAMFWPAPEDVPATLRLAIRLLVARWFENRGDMTGEQTLPPETLALVTQFRRARL